MQELFEVEKWIKITVENIDSIQDRIDSLNYHNHKEVKNINDIKALSEAQKNYMAIIEILERIKCITVREVVIGE